MSPCELETIQLHIEWRHGIIHSAEDMSILNIDKVPKQNLIFAKKQVGEEGIILFTKFIQLFHDRTIQRL